MKKETITLTTIAELLQRLESKMEDKFDRIDARFESIDERFEQIDQRFEQINARFESIDQRFDKMDIKIDTEIEKLAAMVQIGFAAEREITNERFDRIEEKLTFMQQNMNQMNLKICDIQTALPQFVTRNEFEQRLAA